MEGSNLLEKIKKMSPEEKRELIKNIGQTAYYNEATYGGCSQATLAALQQHLGLDNVAAFKAASGLSGGIGLTGESACGGLAGGVMAIGLVYGRDKLKGELESAGFQETLRLSGILCDRFVEQYGSIKCHDVQKIVQGRPFDMRDPEELAKIRADIGKVHDLCGKVCQKAAELAAELILEPAESG